MSANAGEGARKLGEKLLGEVEVGDLSSVLKSLRELQVEGRDSDQPKRPSHKFFGIPELDTLLSSQASPHLELISPPPTHHPSGAGKTSLLHLIIAHAILPPSLSSTPLPGHNAAIILFDPLHHLSIPRLATVMLNILLTAPNASFTPTDLQSTISTSLLHVHIFRPQSWPSTLSTLRSLPDYLFDARRHKSMHRRIHALVLDDVDAFVPVIRCPTSTFASEASFDTSTSSSQHLSTASAQLTSLLRRLSSQFDCGTILTGQSTTPNAFRPALQLDLGGARLAVRRVGVTKFKPQGSVEEAEGERGMRWEVVGRGRFECWKVGVGVKDGEGFVFRVGKKGVEIEKGEE